MLNAGSPTTSKQSGAQGTIHSQRAETVKILQMPGLDVANLGDVQEAEDNANTELRNVAIGAVLLYLCEWLYFLKRRRSVFSRSRTIQLMLSVTDSSIRH